MISVSDQAQCQLQLPQCLPNHLLAASPDQYIEDEDDDDDDEDDDAGDDDDLFHYITTTILPKPLTALHQDINDDLLVETNVMYRITRSLSLNIC